MKIVDPHVDVADMYKFFKYSVKDFFDEKSQAPVTLSKISQADIDIIGFSLYFDRSFVKTSFYDGVNEFYNFYEKIIEKTDRLKLIKTADDVRNKKDGNLGCFYSIEGFECFRSPGDFEEFYDKGVRSFGFTWQCDNKYASGRHAKNDKGISKIGKEVVDLMNKRGKLIVDIAHLSEKSVRDLDKYYQGTIVTTHGNVRSVYKSNHNLKDEEIQIIVDREGVVSLFPLSDDTGKKGTFDEFYKHLEYIAGKWGLDYVAFCSDTYPLPEYPFLHDYNDILIMKHLQEYLLTKLTKDEVVKVMYGNWVRVLTNSL